MTLRGRNITAGAVCAALVIALSLLASASAPAEVRAASAAGAPAIFFVADGLRQDVAAAHAAAGRMPALRDLMRSGAIASDDGLLTQAPADDGPGWFSLATGAWPGAHAVPGNSFHRNGSGFTSAPLTPSSSGVLQAETLAQSAERAGRKVAQIAWVGAGAATVRGPVVDGRRVLSGRGVATNFIDPSDDPNQIAAFGLQFDTPAGFAGQPPFPGAAPAPAAGWTNVPASYSPAQEMRLRVLDFGVDKYGLNAFIYDATDDGVTNYDRVLLSFAKDGAAAVARLAGAQWADVKVTVDGGALAGKTAGFLVKVEELSPDLSRVRLYHSAVTRALASWPGWTTPGFTGNFEEYVAQKFASSPGGDPATVRSGIVSEETFVEQALAWENLYQPLTRYIVATYQPDLAMVGQPIVDELQHEFLGLVTPVLPSGAANPAYDRVGLQGAPDGRVAQRKAFLERAYRSADATLALIQSLMPRKTTTFVASDHGAAPEFLAIDASKVLVDLGLLSKPQTSNCRPATGETIGKAKACWSGGAVHVYLNLAGRDPAGGGLQQVAAADEGATVAQIKAAFLGLSDPNDWNGDGQPDGLPVIQSAFTKAEARYVPNGADSTADLAHPTRTGDTVVFASPPYQFDGGTPGSLIAPSGSFGAHGYRPDLKNLPANISMRGAFIAGGSAVKPNLVALGVRTIDLAPTLAYVMGVPEPQHAQGEVRLDLIRSGADRTLVPVIALTDFHGQLEPTTHSLEGANVSVGGAARLATLFDEESAVFAARPLLVAAGDNVGASPANSSLLQDLPAIDVENGWRLDATAYGHSEFAYGIAQLLQHQTRANFPFLGANIVDASTSSAPAWVQGSRIFQVGSVRVGVIGIALKATPELVSAGATAGLAFLDEIAAIKAESERLRRRGVKVQIVLVHQGVTSGGNAVDGTPPTPWAGPVLDVVDGIQGTTVDVVLAGHTHAVSNLMRGHILVAQGLDGGASYSLAQLVVYDGEVEWAGASTRLAKTLGVAQRADVKAIVDDANAQAAVLRNAVVGTQQFDIRRDPARLAESAMGNMVADAMRARYPGVDAALTNSGGLRADLICAPPSSAGEPACAITWGEMFAVLPFGNRTVILTLNGAQLEQAFLNGVSPTCNPAIATGRSPQVSGLELVFTCNGTTPVVTGMYRTPQGVGGPAIPIGPSDLVRVVTNDFMYGGEDGYTVLSQGTNVLVPGEDLLQVAIDYVSANSPVGPVVEGRIVEQ